MIKKVIRHVLVTVLLYLLSIVWTMAGILLFYLSVYVVINFNFAANEDANITYIFIAIFSGIASILLAFIYRINILSKRLSETSIPSIVKRRIVGVILSGVTCVVIIPSLMRAVTQLPEFGQLSNTYDRNLIMLGANLSAAYVIMYWALVLYVCVSRSAQEPK